MGSIRQEAEKAARKERRLLAQIITLPRVKWLEGPDPSEYFK